MIYCKIIKDDDVYKVIATEEERSITVAVKSNAKDAKELAFSLYEAKKVDEVDITEILND